MLHRFVDKETEVQGTVSYLRSWDNGQVWGQHSNGIIQPQPFPIKTHLGPQDTTLCCNFCINWSINSRLSLSLFPSDEGGQLVVQLRD